jgi:hypothetical protein
MSMRIAAAPSVSLALMRELARYLPALGSPKKSSTRNYDPCGQVWCPIGFARIAACKALSRTLRDCRFVPSSRTRAESGGADKQGSQ